jgi:hypothetical protein
MQSNYGSAIKHVQSGMKILSEVQYNEQQPYHSVLEAAAVPYIPMEVLEELFMRLDLQVTQLKPCEIRDLFVVLNKVKVVGPEEQSLISDVTRKYTWRREIPPAFLSLHEARDSFVLHWHMMYVCSYFSCSPGVDHLSPTRKEGWNISLE